jgi:hypothetical protein
MPAREAKDGQRRRYLVRYDFSRIRELWRGTQDLPRTVQRGEPCVDIIQLANSITDNTRISSPVASINALAKLVQKEKQVPPTTAALTALPLSETLWIHLQKAQTTSLATPSHTSPSIKGLARLLFSPNARPFFLFDVFMLLSDYHWSENASFLRNRTFWELDHGQSRTTLG